MLKMGEGGGLWLGDYSLDLIGIQDALWQAASTARGAQDTKRMASYCDRARKRKERERKGERMGKLESNIARKEQLGIQKKRRSHHRLGKPWALPCR
jgi:hypothetical protein